jgi:hypothetical protein
LIGVAEAGRVGSQRRKELSMSDTTPSGRDPRDGDEVVEITPEQEAGSYVDSELDEDVTVIDDGPAGEYTDTER